MIVKQNPQCPKQRDVLGTVEPSAARSLHGPDHGKAGFPEAQDVGRHSHLFGGLRNRPKGFRTLGHGLLGEGAVDARLHHLTGAEADHPTRFNGRGLAGLGVPPHPGPL